MRPEAVVRSFRITSADNKSYDTQHHNLNVIISVAHGVKSFAWLEGIRDISSSERVFGAGCSTSTPRASNYDPGSDASKLFFQTVRDKMHWAIVGRTTAEIVHVRASAAKPQTGLTSWSSDRPRKGDVSLAKNYLNENEIKGGGDRRSRLSQAEARRLRLCGIELFDANENLSRRRRRHGAVTCRIRLARRGPARNETPRQARAGL